MKQLVGKTLDVVAQHYIKLLENKVIVAFDTETTHLNPNKGQLTEIAAILYMPEFSRFLDFSRRSDFHVKVELLEETKIRMAQERLALRLNANPLLGLDMPMEMKELVKLAKVDKGLADVLKEVRTNRNFRTSCKNLRMTKYHKLELRAIKEKNALLGLMDLIVDLERENQNLILVAQNAKFDMGFIAGREQKHFGLIDRNINALTGIPVIDTVEFLKLFYLPAIQALRDKGDKFAVEFLDGYKFGRHGLPSASLGLVAERLGLNTDNWHNALADTELTMKVFGKCLQQISIIGWTADILPYQRNVLLMDRYYSYYQKGKKKPKLYKGILQ